MSKPAVTKEGGECLAAPDTCNVPQPGPPGGVPTPFPNKGSCASIDKATKKVKFNKKGVAIQTSIIPRSSGDEAGSSNLPTPKGLMSQKNMDEIEFKEYSSKVIAENKGVVPYLARSSHNGGGNDNAPMGKVVAPSQTKILIN